MPLKLFLSVMPLLLVCCTGFSQQPASMRDSAMVFKNAGMTFGRANVPDSSIFYSLKALVLFEKLNDIKQMGQTEWALAAMYSAIKQHVKAAHYCEKGIAHSTEVKDWHNLGLLYMAKSATLTHPNLGKNISKEVYTLNKEAYSFFCLSNDSARMANALANVGVYYTESTDERNFDSAIHYYQLSNDINLKYNKRVSALIVYDNIARLLMLQKKYVEAGTYAQKSAALSASEKNYEMLKKSYNKLTTIYIYLDKHDSANHYMRQYAAVLDTFFSNKLSATLSEAEAKYETQKKQGQIESLTKDNSIQSLQLKNQQLEIDAKEYMIQSQQLMLINDSLELKNRNENLAMQQQANKLKEDQLQRLGQQAIIKQLDLDNRQLEVKRKNLILVFISVSALLLAISAYLFYRRFRTKKEQQLKLALSQQEHLATQALFEGEQKERIRIARDLHDSIGQMLSVVKMQVSSLQSVAAKEAGQLAINPLALVDRAITEVRSISHNLIPEELNFGLITAIEELCSNMQASGKATFDFTYDEALKQSRLSKQTELSIYRIVQEVLGNMAKHADATSITIAITAASNNTISLQLTDNGKGFNTAIISESKGLGWKNIFARVKLLNGNIMLQSEKTTGTLIQITIPQ